MRQRRIFHAAVLIAAIVITMVSAVLGWPYGRARFFGSGADLLGARLVRAPLAGADLRKADLRAADLRKANLRGARLDEANLDGALLQGTDLRGTNLDDRRGTPDYVLPVITPPPGASVFDAKYDDRTQWPAGFDVVSAGAVRVE